MGWRPQLGEERWTVNQSVGPDSIYIYVHKGLTTFVEIGHWHVRKPNFIERWLGITLEDKVEKTINKAVKLCNKLNKDEDGFKSLAEKWSDTHEEVNYFRSRGSSNTDN